MTKAAIDNRSTTMRRTIHCGWLRLLHALNAIAVLGLMSSGWAIYNADPYYGFVFSVSISLGGYLTDALRWHLALAWLFSVTALLFLSLRLFNSIGGPRLRPVSGPGFFADVWSAVRGRLTHRLGEYNQVQRVAYSGVIVLFSVAMLSGLALWKPVQLLGLSEFLGGYEWSRRVHFWAMGGIALFVVVHLFMVALTPRTILTMILGAEKNGYRIVETEECLVKSNK